MTNLKAFLSQNKIKTENRKVVASKNFIDEDGKPIKWEIKKISASQNDAIQQECTRMVTTRKGVKEPQFDASLYSAKVCAMATVFPELNNAELQDSYGVKKPEDLLKEMLDAGEYLNYQSEVYEHNGFNVSQDELVEEAKN